MYPSRRRPLRASHAGCACREPSAATCSKLRASAIPSGPATGMTRLRRCWPASMRSMVPPTFSIAPGARAAGMRRRPSCSPDGSMPTAKKTCCATSFSGPKRERSFLTGPPRAHRVVAEFRAAVTGYADDPDIRRLVDELRIGSADFERCWETQGVLAREGGERAFNHPTMGPLHYQQVSLSLAGWPDYRLTMLLSAPAVPSLTSRRREG